VNGNWAYSDPVHHRDRQDQRRRDQHDSFADRNYSCGRADHDGEHLHAGVFAKDPPKSW
jgi:hypothetical protein